MEQEERFSKEAIHLIYKITEHLKNLYDEGKLLVYITNILYRVPELSLSTPIQEIGQVLEKGEPINSKLIVYSAIEIYKKLPQGPTDD
ncbi:hypothetical protein A2125_00090 [Candidatus Woesebacteria bacterium GWB1_43_5]|uniref:Uncharacterized protein n=1 Tax=Candidatus Woesebacteria bacterium GWB1_43_5 TaxID=1802474 RepID=A0A1F7WSC7_9BACT|nr:MAG: hypothetical protein A2125_00090 [Candidatus Woesebacteria bacterium GWB1_43_5]